MAVYTFYPRVVGGAASCLDFADLPDDEAAHRHADHLRRNHASCVSVEIWCGNRRVAAEAAAPVVAEQLLAG